MKTLILLAWPFFTFLISCNPSADKFYDKIGHGDTTYIPDNLINKKSDTVLINIKPVFGYRFVITGDFNGDGIKEKLIEHFFSSIDNKEANKFYDSLTDYAELVDLTIKKEPFSFLVSDNSIIDTLHISNDKQLLGLSYLKNEGDLNGNGSDEISYVVNWADWSNLNTCNIMTYRNKEWESLYSFPIWDWQLPDLPEAVNDYGLFGLNEKLIYASSDSNNKLMEKQLNDFSGLVKKIATNKIQIVYRNDEANEDTMIVDLNYSSKK